MPPSKPPEIKTMCPCPCNKLQNRHTQLAHQKKWNHQQALIERDPLSAFTSDTPPTSDEGPLSSLAMGLGPQKRCARTDWTQNAERAKKLHSHAHNTSSISAPRSSPTESWPSSPVRHQEGTSTSGSIHDNPPDSSPVLLGLGILWVLMTWSLPLVASKSDSPMRTSAWMATT